MEIAIYNRYRRGRVANAEVLARSEVHLIVRGDHPLARRREIAVRALADVALALPTRPNSLTSALTGLAASQHFDLDIGFEAGSTPLIKEGDPGLRPRHHLAPARIRARDRIGRVERHVPGAAGDLANHLDVAEFAPATDRRRPAGRPGHFGTGGQAAKDRTEYLNPGTTPLSGKRHSGAPHTVL